MKCGIIKHIAAAMIMIIITAAPASALSVIDNMDSGKPYSAKIEKSDIKEGSGALTVSGSSGTLVLQRKFDPAVDISSYTGVGYAKLYLYIESVGNMSDTSGQLELTSSGGCDVEETSWNISKNMLKDGWNTLTLSFESPGENNADLSAINYLRVYIHITGKNKLMLDELSIGTAKELGIEAAGVELSAPVKTPEEVYGEGGAIAAAKAPKTIALSGVKAVSNNTGTTAAQEPAAETQPDSPDTGTPAASANKNSGHIAVAVKTASVVIAVAAAAAIFYAVIKRRRKK